MIKTLTKAVRPLVTAVVLLLSIGAAQAQQVCTVHDAAIDDLERRFAEKVVGRGLTSDGAAMLELLVSDDSSWTVILTDVYGRSCIVAGGVGWTEQPLLIGDPA